MGSGLSTPRLHVVFFYIICPLTKILLNRLCVLSLTAKLLSNIEIYIYTYSCHMDTE